MSVNVSYKKQSFLGIILLLIVIGIVEGGARVYDFAEPNCSLKEDKEVYAKLDFWKKSDICESWSSLVWGFDEKSNVYMPEPNQHKKTVNINSDGFRGPEITRLETENEYRIFMVGGSTTASLRATSDEATIPGYLQSFFELNERKIRVINAGVPGIASTQELQLVEKKIVEFNPDLVIVYDGTNDINLPYGYQPGKESLRNTFSDGLNRYLPFWETPSIIYHMTLSGKEIKLEFDDTNIDKKVKLWRNNIENICNLGNEKDFQTLIILQPILGSGNKVLTEYEMNQFERFDHLKVVPAYEKFADELNYLENDCSRVVDFRNAFDGIEKTVFFDNAHVGIESNKIIAEKIYQILLQMI